MTTLTLLAHGSPDPRHARDVSGLAARLAAAGVPAQVAYLDHHSPTPTEAAQAVAEAGQPDTTVVPLLVAPAYHARVDVPAAVRQMRAAVPTLSVTTAEPVGLHPLLLRAAAELAQAAPVELGPRTGVILAAAGSRDLRATAAIETLVRQHGAEMAQALGVAAVRTSYLDGGRPMGRIRTLLRCVDGCTSVVAVPLVIADGLLRDRMVRAADRADIPLAPGSLADTAAMADLVRLRAALAVTPTIVAPRRAASSHRTFVG